MGIAGRVAALTLLGRCSRKLRFAKSTNVFHFRFMIRPQSAYAVLLTLLCGLVLLFAITSSALAYLTVSQNFEGTGGGAAGVLRGPKLPKDTLLKPEDAGIEVSVPIEMVGPAQFGEVPIIHATVAGFDGAGSNRYGPATINADGVLSLKIHPETARGKLQLKQDSMRLLNSSEFTVVNGIVRFADPIQIESACRLTIHVRCEGASQKKPIFGAFLRSRRKPGLKAAVPNGWTKEQEGKILLGPLVPTDVGWVIVKCRGYGTVRVSLSKGLLKWQGDEEIHVDLVPECELSLRLHPLEDFSIGPPRVTVNNSPWGLSYGQVVSLSGGGRAWSMKGLAPGTYHALVGGSGLLPAVHKLSLEANSNVVVEWDLKANPGLGVRGRVVSPLGQPTLSLVRACGVCGCGRPMCARVRPWGEWILLVMTHRVIAIHIRHCQGRSHRPSGPSPNHLDDPA